MSFLRFRFAAKQKPGEAGNIRLF